MTSHDHRGTQGYETSDARVRPLVVFAGGLVALVLLALLLGLWLDASWTPPLSAADEAQGPASRRAPPSWPVLQADPTSELEQHRAWEEELLNEYRWIDRGNDLARIPIERAMRITIRRINQELGAPTPDSGPEEPWSRDSGERR